MRVQGFIGVIIIVLVIIAAIVIGNFFFSTFLGVDIDKLPPFMKTLIHLAGLAAVLFIIKKVFVK